MTKLLSEHEEEWLLEIADMQVSRLREVFTPSTVRKIVEHMYVTVCDPPDGDE